MCVRVSVVGACVFVCVSPWPCVFECGRVGVEFVRTKPVLQSEKKTLINIRTIASTRGHITNQHTHALSTGYRWAHSRVEHGMDPQTSEHSQRRHGVCSAQQACESHTFRGAHQEAHTAATSAVDNAADYQRRDDRAHDGERRNGD